jgi:DNA-binding NtrC family response regulator
MNQTENAEMLLPLRDVLRAAARQHVESILQATGGNKSRAARSLDVSRLTLYRKLDDLGIGDGK